LTDSQELLLFSFISSAPSEDSFFLAKNRADFTARVSSKLMLRAYSDCQPHSLETASLQKGLVLVWQGRELVGEGTGFGLPIVKYSERTCLSSTATISVNNTPKDKSEESVFRITKCFTMDTISRKTLANKIFVDGTLYKGITRLIQRNYREKTSSRWITKPLVELRNPLLGIRTMFCRIQPKGYVTMVYDIFADRIVVKADFGKVSKKNCERLFVMNEQSSTFFRKYSDSNGETFRDNKIGAWDRVEAHRATLSDINDEVCFALRRLPNCKLYRGRERIRERLDWAGLDYELNSNINSFEYIIYFDKSANESTQQS
jgi:hypothetical protein